MRQLKGLEAFIDVATVHPYMGAMGWSFYPPIRGEEGSYPATTGEVGKSGSDSIGGVVPDPLYESKFARDLYFRAEKGYSGRCVLRETARPRELMWGAGSRSRSCGTRRRRRSSTTRARRSSACSTPRCVSCACGRIMPQLIPAPCVQFNSELPASFAAVDLFPSALQAEIEAQNTWVYDTVR